MGVWSSIILILAMSGVFGFGFYLMTKLDKFLDENQKAIEKENESREPFCVMLTNSLTDEEIFEEIRRFRKRHEDINEQYDIPDFTKVIENNPKCGIIYSIKEESDDTDEKGTNT